MRFRVEYAPRSTRDLTKIRDYIIKESRSRETADRYLARLLNACEAICFRKDNLDDLPVSFDHADVTSALRILTRQRNWF